MTNSSGETDDHRRVLRISGPDRVAFLQDLVTNDVTRDGLTYAALLTPQGKYLADFFLLPRSDDILLDVDADLSQGLAQRLTMYRLRKKVQIEDAGLFAIRGLGNAPDDAHADPRDPALGWRAYRDTPGTAPNIDWDAIRVAQTVPATTTELNPDTFILEAGFERMKGVDFRKGCYVGQEVTARMKHKTELRKGFVTVTITGPADPGTEITTEDGKPAGTLHTRAGDQAIAYLRFDRATGPLSAGAAQIKWTA